MNANVNGSSNARNADVVEAEVARGELDDVLDEYPSSGRAKVKKIKKRPCSKLSPKITKYHDVSRVVVKSISTRIEELARPTKQRVLVTLRERTSTLPPAFVDNLIRILKTETCLTPEQAARALHKKKRKKKETRLPSATKKTRQITKLDAVATLDRDATMCQYLMAERFVRNILEHRCRTQSKDFHEIAQVILQHLRSLDGYVTVQNDDDRATQQLHLLADIVACWIVEILVEVAEKHKEALEEYCKKRRTKMMEIDDDNDDDETDNEIEDWKQIEQMKMRKEKEERMLDRKKFERERTNEEKNNEWKKGDMEYETAKREEMEKRKYDELNEETKDKNIQEIKERMEEEETKNKDTEEIKERMQEEEIKNKDTEEIKEGMEREEMKNKDTEEIKERMKEEEIKDKGTEEIKEGMEE